MFGQHLIRSYSKTQATIALSSAEAELAGIVKISAEILGLVAMMKDVGVYLTEKAMIYADASAAQGIVQRKGAGNIRHINTRLLWVQEQEAKNKMRYIKIAGTINPSDMGTKHLEPEAIRRHMASWNLEELGGRAATAPGKTTWGPQPEKELTAIGSLTVSSGSPQLWGGGGCGQKCIYKR